VYTDRFFNLIQSTSVYETNSGSIPQLYLQKLPQDKAFIRNDYNGNGAQELQEFEVAPFIDQAAFIRIFYPIEFTLKHIKISFHNQ
jgi:hypothetical protein